MNEAVVLVLLTAVVAVQAYSRFHSPPSNRSTTTALRYYAAAAFYSLVYVVVFCVLTQYPSMFHALQTVFHLAVPPADTAVLTTGSAQSITIALVVNTVLPNTPMIRNLDAAFRRQLKVRALIGYEAFVVGGQLFDSRFEIPEAVRSDVSGKLRAHGLSDGALDANGADEAERLWVRIVSLMASFAAFDHDAAFAPFKSDGRVEFAKITNRYGRLEESAVTLFKALRPRLGRANEEVDGVVVSFETSFKKEAAGLYRSMCYLLSRAALSRGLTERRRIDLLRSAGFIVRPTTNSTLDGASLMFILMFVVTMFVNVAITPDEDPVAMAKRGLLVVSSATISIITAWAFRVSYGRDHEPDHMRPVFSYAVAGVVATFAFLPLRLVLRIWMDPGYLSSGTGNPNSEWPYLLITFLATFGLAWCLDNRGEGRLRGVYLSAAEAASMGGLLVAAAIVVIALREPGAHYFAKDWSLLAVSFAHGVLIGALVPAWRRSPDRRERRAIVRRFQLGEAHFV